MNCKYLKARIRQSNWMRRVFGLVVWFSLRVWEVTGSIPVTPHPSFFNIIYFYFHKLVVPLKDKLIVIPWRYHYWLFTIIEGLHHLGSICFCYYEIILLKLSLNKIWYFTPIVIQVLYKTRWLADNTWLWSYLLIIKSLCCSVWIHCWIETV